MKKYVSAILALLLMLNLVGCQESQSTVTAPELLEPVGVKLDTTSVEKSDIYCTTSYDGSVVPYVQTLYFPISTKLGEINVTWGDEVKEGQVLASADQSKPLKAIKEQEEKIAHEEKLAYFSDSKAQADIDIARAQLELIKSQGATAEELNVQWIKILQLEASLRQTQQLREIEMAKEYAALEELKKEQQDVDIVAPFSGRVVYINTKAKSGSTVSETTPMFVIADNSRTYVTVSGIKEQTLLEAYKVYARVLEQDVDLTRLKEEDNPDLAEVFDAAGEMVFGYELEKPLETGLYAAVILVSDYKENVLNVPINAVYRDKGGSYVYKMVDGERVHCPVTTGIYTDTRIEILDGLQEGDVVYVQS